VTVVDVYSVTKVDKICDKKLKIVVDIQ